MSSPAEQQFPVRVLVVDAENEPPAVPALRADGRRWAGLWLVVRRAGAPVGVVEADFDGADELSASRVRGLVDGVTSAAAPIPAQAADDARLPSASVVVPTNLARPEQLRAALVALDGLDYPDAEIVLVDNSRTGSPDLVARVVEGLSRVRVVREPVPGISAARNAGVRAARGEVIAFTDDDVEVDPGWLRALGARFSAQPGADGVTGLILPAELETVPQLWFERHYGGFGATRMFVPLTYQGRGAVVTVRDRDGAQVRRFAVYGAGACGAGANMAFRASALARVGGFDEALGTGTPARGGEDLAMFVRLLWKGGVIAYEPSAVVFHTHRADYPSLRGQIEAYGLGFTAMLTSLVRSDPRHVAGVLSQLPRVARRALPRAGAADLPQEAAPLGPPVPAELARLERAGALRGPAAYLRSRRATRRRSAVAGSAGQADGAHPVGGTGSPVVAAGSPKGD